MAPFNPNIPQTTPPPESYLGATRPLSPWDIGVNRTVQAGISGLGDVLKVAVSGADDVIKSAIDQGLRTSITQERDAQTGALEQLAGVPQDDRISPYQVQSGESIGGNTGSTDIIPGATAAPVPAGLQPMNNQVANVATGASVKPALATYYTGKLDMIAKDYRSQYPGYSDYIDQRVANMTGGNPANQRIQDLMSLIKATQGNANQEKEKALGYVGENAGIAGAPGVAQNIATGQIPNGQSPMAYAINWASKWKGIDYDTKQQIQQNSLWQGNNANLVTQNQQSASGIATKVSDQLWSQMLDSTKMTPESLADIAQKVKTGVIPHDDQRDMAYSQAMQSAAVQAQRQIEDRLNQKGPDGRSMADIIGPTNVKNIVDGATQRYTAIADMFGNKDTGTAFSSARFVTVQGNQTNAWLLRDSPQKDFFNFQRAVTQNGGPAASGLLMEKLLSGKYGNMDDSIKEFAHFNTLRLAAQPNNPLDLTLDDLQKRGTTAGAKIDPSAYKYFTDDLPSQIANTKLDDTSRTNLATNVFNGIITSKFDNDTFDGKGNLIPGKHTVLTNMTKPEIADSVWKLGGGSATSPLWLQYKNWVTRNTNDTMTTDVKNLDGLSVNPNLDFKWDPKNSQLGIDAKDTFFVNPYSGKGGPGLIPGFRQQQSDSVAQTQFNTYKQSVAMFNASIKPLVNIAQKEGLDPNAFVIQQLQNMGADPDSRLMQSITGKHSAAEAPVKVASAESDTPVTDAIRNFVTPHLQDWTQATPTVAHPEQIKGTANAAIPNETWGNPLDPNFKSQHLTTIESPNGKPVQVNKVAADAFKGFLSDLAKTGYKIDDVQGYNLRESKSGGISQHAFGNAIDVNPDRNPFVGNPFGAGKMKSDMPKNVSDLAAKWGITWGGDWHSVKDPMHFEYTGRKPQQNNQGFKLSAQ